MCRTHSSAGGVYSTARGGGGVLRVEWREWIAEVVGRGWRMANEGATQQQQQQPSNKEAEAGWQLRTQASRRPASVCRRRSRCVESAGVWMSVLREGVGWVCECVWDVCGMCG